MSKQHECTQERFLNDVKDHQISIEKDDGVHRFVRFRRANGSPYYWFDLITWPGNLCISGDCGTYVFSREQDMFGFFKMGDGDFNKKKGVLLNINPHYWGEKLQSIGTNEGYMKFDYDKFEERVKEYFESMSDEFEDERKNELWEAIKGDVLLHTDDEHQAYQAIHNFDYEGIRFSDFFDGGGTESYTFHYIWNLYAIVWGIMKYDEAKNASK